jgi:sRNA-binding carbon storage regulator CsrA
MALTMDLKPGQKLQVGDATITMESKSGQLARLVIDAPKSVTVKKLEASSPAMKLIAEQGLMTA